MLVDMIGDRLKELRTAAGMNQPEFAAIVGTSKQYVSQLESGKNITPSGEYLEGWARHFRVNLRWLVSGTGPKHAEAPSAKGSQLMRLDPLMLSQAYKTLLSLDPVADHPFSLGNLDDAAHFVQVYEMRAAMPVHPSQEEWIEFGRKLATLTPTGGDDGRGGGAVPAEGTHKGKVAGKVRRKA